MDTSALGTWIRYAERTASNPWDSDSVGALALQSVPESVLGTSAALLRSDISSTWLQWFIEGLTDIPRCVSDPRITFGHMYDEIMRQLRNDHPAIPNDEIRGLARILTESSWAEVVRRRQLGRVNLSPVEREEIWFRHEPVPRCYLCGYKFGQLSKDRFLRRVDRNRDTELPKLVDFVRPRGQFLRDLDAEVDHVRPVAAGGETTSENLRLACGWCNRTKNRFSLIYDAPTWSTRTCDHPILGHVSVPQPLWVLRVVAVRARCDSPEGCSAKLTTHELFVAPRNSAGAINPSNCAVFCSEHDPWATKRFIGRDLVRDQSK